MNSVLMSGLDLEPVQHIVKLVDVISSIFSQLKGVQYERVEEKHPQRLPTIPMTKK